MKSLDIPTVITPILVLPSRGGGEFPGFRIRTKLRREFLMNSPAFIPNIPTFHYSITPITRLGSVYGCCKNFAWLS
jgi:hypothetical protein